MRSQYRTRYLIHNVAYDAWINRMADSLTRNMFAAIWFHTLEEAEHWMQGIYGPEDKTDFEIQKTVTTIEVAEGDKFGIVF